MITLLEPFLPYILGGLGLVLALFGYGRRQKAKGRSEAAKERLEARLKGIQTHKEVQDDVQGMDDARVADELARWRRDRVRHTEH